MKKYYIILGLLVVLVVGYLLIKSTKDKPILSTTIKEQTEFYSIDASYPEDVWDKEGVMNQVVHYMANQKKDEWKVGGDVYNEEQKISKDFPDRPKMKYQLEIGYTATTSKKYSTRSYVFSVYEFTGGAHGNTAVATFTFDKNGQIKIEDLINFENENDIKLTKLLGTKLEKLFGDDVNLDMIRNGLGLAFLRADNTFDVEKCKCDGFFFPSNFQNFVVRDEGLKFIMGQYQVAPYVYGMPEVVFGWEELRPFMTQNSRLHI